MIARENGLEPLLDAILADRDCEPEALAQGFIGQPQADALHNAASVAFTDGTHIAFLVMAAVAVVASFLIGHFIPDELPMARKPAPAGAPNVPTGPTHAHGPAAPEGGA